MRPHLALGLLAAALASPSSARHPANDGPRPCIPTAPMPLLAVHAEHLERMPVFSPDSAWLQRMPTIPLRPCYLHDALALPVRR